jgi:hypothetical protein
VASPRKTRFTFGSTGAPGASPPLPQCKGGTQKTPVAKKGAIDATKQVTACFMIVSENDSFENVD